MFLKIEKKLFIVIFIHLKYIENYALKILNGSGWDELDWKLIYHDHVCSNHDWFAPSTTQSFSCFVFVDTLFTCNAQQLRLMNNHHIPIADLLTAILVIKMETFLDLLSSNTRFNSLSKIIFILYFSCDLELFIVLTKCIASLLLTGCYHGHSKGLPS